MLPPAASVGLARFLQLELQDALSDAGYQTVSAYDGTEALAILEKDATNIKGIVADIRLGPGSTGWEVVRRARELNATIAVVYASADSAGDWPSEGVPRSIMLQKPFAMAQVVTALSQALNNA